MKICFIIFHKNSTQYPKDCIKMCLDSIRNQTYKKFDVLEIDYGGTGKQIYEGSNFESMEMSNHATAHNYLCDKAVALGYDYIANVNIDDHYSPLRLEKQLPYMEQGYDIISSNFYNINDTGIITRQNRMNILNIEEEANKNHNIICHPVVCYSKKFCSTCTMLDPDEIPRDDFNLWKRSYGKFKFVILPEYLAYYRIHQFKICNR